MGLKIATAASHSRTNTVIDMNGLQFLRAWALPHFYFHAVTAYDILRTSGVPLGKRDYEGRLRTRTA